MFLISLAQIVAWICIGSAVLCLFQVKEGFSKLEACMGLMCAAALLFMFPVLTKSIYHAGETNGGINRPDSEFVSIYPVKLTDEQNKERWNKFNRTVTENGQDPMLFEDWMTKCDSTTVQWGELTEEQKIEINKRQKDENGKILSKNGNEHLGISSVVALVLMLILVAAMQYVRFVWNCYYCILAPILWLWYIVL